LINGALGEGGSDNVTVVIVDIDGNAAATGVRY
jgi:serine/threonine protein phosphatase PrpC